MLDGTFKRFISTDPGEPTGRIKCGTESNGGFRNIAISNCVFETCRGLALESVDGGHIENITFTGITMRDIRNAPFFLRLGARLRGPQGISVGTLRRVIISNIICEAAANEMPAIISGIPDHQVEDISISDVFMVQKGGGSAALADVNPPEQERDYPEPNRLGPLPAQGLFVRHARNLEVRHVEIAHVADDARPCVWLNDVDRVDFVALKLPPEGRAPAFSLRQTRRLRVSGSATLADVSLDYVASGLLP